MTANKVVAAKVLVIGEQGVGKSSLVAGYVQGSFDEAVKSTVGASYFERTEEIGDHVVKLKIWDTAGQERYKSLIPMYYRKSDAALLVYDVTNRESFRSLGQWKAELQNNSELDAILVVVGNKCDGASGKRVIYDEEGRAFAKSIGAHYHEVSALENQGVREMFVDLCVKIILARQSADQRSTNQRAPCDPPVVMPSAGRKTSVCCR